ncbi:protease SohB [Permianibacter sp. IMCC34836]|uniref:protease SohB n=1 Tax=Permianibacter fluminis TaxID=2738515 RepID=UPI001556F836|nr:protease SohB [Permianibacter fluminis]NQD38758.1 protease SohB [Permianibacter fluminis]
MQFFYEYGLFLAKSATIVFAILLVIGGIVRSRQQRHQPAPGEIEVRNLSDEYKDLTDTMYAEILDLDEYKARHKAELKKEKEEAKARKKALKQAQKDEARKAAEPEAATTDSDADAAEEDEEEELERKPRVFVLNFLGDMEASSVHCLREEITAVLSVAEKDAQDEVILRLESPGGLVHSYGHAASQLQRIRDAGLPLTAVVDEVAASGGYMMACVADKIVAAPFAVIGSIGVVAELPNFNRLLKRFDIDYEQHTAGQFKRTLTMFGENSDEGRRKFQEELEDTHKLFKAYVGEHRSQVDLEKVATGEHWYGSQALELGLVDELQTSDALLQELYPTHDVYEVNYEFRKTLADRLSLAAFMSVDKLLMRWWQRSASRHGFIR